MTRPSLFSGMKAADFVVARSADVRSDLLTLRDRVAVLDPNEDPDSPAGCAAAEVLAIHNRLVTGVLPDDAA